MSAAVQINLKDSLTPALDALAHKLTPNRLAQVLSEPCRIFWRDRLKSLGTNKRGWPSTGFWEDAARKTTAAVRGDALVLTCNKVGVRQRALGGVIKPVKADALTIPISPVSYGRSAREFPGLFLIKTAKGAYLVQPGEKISSAGNVVRGTGLGGNTKRRMRAGLNFLFKLVSSVNQKANPEVIPTADEFGEVIMGTIHKELAA